MTNAVTIDTRGLRCPLPVLRVMKHMREHQNTHNFQVLATDPIAESEIRALCEANGWALDKDESEVGEIVILRIARAGPGAGEANQT